MGALWLCDFTTGTAVYLGIEAEWNQRTIEYLARTWNSDYEIVDEAETWGRVYLNFPWRRTTEPLDPPKPRTDFERVCVEHQLRRRPEEQFLSRCVAYCRLYRKLVKPPPPLSGEDDPGDDIDGEPAASAGPEPSQGEERG